MTTHAFTVELATNDLLVTKLGPLEFRKGRNGTLELQRLVDEDDTLWTWADLGDARTLTVTQLFADSPVLQFTLTNTRVVSVVVLPWTADAPEVQPSEAAKLVFGGWARVEL